MRIRRCTWSLWMLQALLALGLTAAATFPALAAPLRVMILDGESAGAYHRWDETTPVLRRMLEETGLFTVDVVTAPAANGSFAHFHPDFAKYQVVVVNYDAPDGRWPRELQDAFEQYVRGGGGVAMVHAADNAFPGWPAWNQMNGVGGWRGRNESAGPFWYFERGALRADASPGPAGSHGRRDPFEITVRADHPITRGLPARFLHAGDELYARLRGPGRDMKVLATAWSDPANAGSGRDEPMLMVLQFGRGRIFHTTLGHDVAAMSSVDFIVTLQRGVEWAATGKVTQPVPADFPTGVVRARPLSFIRRGSDGHPDWGGIWQRQGGIGLDPQLKPGQIDRPPLTPEYQAMYDASLASLKAGRPVADPTASCAPPNGVRLMNMVYPMEIFQRPGLVAVFAEWDHQVRRIYTDGRRPDASTERTYLGYSVGHWEGDELVAETTLFKGAMVLNQSGLTLSEDVVMRERWKQTDADTLTDTITLVDAKALREPFTYVKTFKRAEPGFEIMEYTCVENNRNPILPDGTTGTLLPGR